MFDSPDAARQILLQQFSKPQVEIVVEALEPSILFRPEGGGAARPGGTRLGGTPDIPPGFGWPAPKIPENAAEIATRGAPEANEELAEHFQAALPYAFFAQVDLAEAKASGAEDLPGDGRLLFFYDLIAGPYATEGWTARVIWDQSPLDQLKPAALPRPLVEAAARRREATAESDRRLRAEFGEDAVATRPGAGTPYDPPGRAMRLRATLRPPERAAIEAAARPALRKLIEADETAAGAYGDLFAKRFDPFYDRANAGHRNQLLGGPLPEQDDPRYQALAAGDFGRERFSAEDFRTMRAEIEAKARDWRLLLQVDIADLLQDSGEGTVYFLIRRADLEQRRFDRVIAVYQQT